jgi:hypothetical protein
MRQLVRRDDLASDIVEVDAHLFGSIYFSGDCFGIQILADQIYKDAELMLST